MGADLPPSPSGLDAVPTNGRRLPASGSAAHRRDRSPHARKTYADSVASKADGDK